MDHLRFTNNHLMIGDKLHVFTGFTSKNFRYVREKIDETKPHIFHIFITNCTEPDDREALVEFLRYWTTCSKHNHRTPNITLYVPSWHPTIIKFAVTCLETIPSNSGVTIANGTTFSISVDTFPNKFMFIYESGTLPGENGKLLTYVEAVGAENPEKRLIGTNTIASPSEKDIKRYMSDRWKPVTAVKPVKDKEETKVPGTDKNRFVRKAIFKDGDIVIFDIERLGRSEDAPRKFRFGIIESIIMATDDNPDNDSCVILQPSGDRCVRYFNSELRMNRMAIAPDVIIGTSKVDCKDIAYWTESIRRNVKRRRSVKQS